MQLIDREALLRQLQMTREGVMALHPDGRQGTALAKLKCDVIKVIEEMVEAQETIERV